MRISGILTVNSNPYLDSLTLCAPTGHTTQTSPMAKMQSRWKMYLGKTWYTYTPWPPEYCLNGRQIRTSPPWPYFGTKLWTGKSEIRPVEGQVVFYPNTSGWHITIHSVFSAISFKHPAWPEVEVGSEGLTVLRIVKLVGNTSKIFKTRREKVSNT